MNIVEACGPTPPHALGGDHILCDGVDMIPRRLHDWDSVDRMAAYLGWRPSCGSSGCRGARTLNRSLSMIFYDGYPGHGRGNHIHVSWRHAYVGAGPRDRANAASNPQPMATWVMSFLSYSGSAGKRSSMTVDLTP